MLLLSALVISTGISARTLVPFTVTIDDENISISNGYPKSPIQPPTVYIEDYTLSFVVDHPDYILIIKEEDGEVVYNSTVYSSQTQVALPSTLSGDYEIELVMGCWLFTGWINL